MWFLLFAWWRSKIQDLFLQKDINWQCLWACIKINLITILSLLTRCIHFVLLEFSTPKVLAGCSRFVKPNCELSRVSPPGWRWTLPVVNLDKPQSEPESFAALFTTQMITWPVTEYKESGVGRRVTFICCRQKVLRMQLTLAKAVEPRCRTPGRHIRSDFRTTRCKCCWIRHFREVPGGKQKRPTANQPHKSTCFASTARAKTGKW